MRRVLLLMGLAVTGFAFLAHFLDPGGIRSVENALFDQYQKWQPRTYDPDVPVRIIDIDEESLRRYGQWPWPRTYMAALTRRLRDLQVGAVGYDVLFAEPDRTSPKQIADSWRRFDGAEVDLGGAKDLPDHDQVFAAALREVPSVLSIAGSNRKVDLGPTKPRAGISPVGQDPTEVLDRYPGALTNLPNLTEAASGVGVISLGNTTGQVIRQVAMITVIGDRTMPSLAAELLRVAQGAGYTLKATGAQSEGSAGSVRAVSLRIGAAVVPLTWDGGFLLHYSGTKPQRSIPAWRVLEGDPKDPRLQQELTGRLVIIGSSAQALRDIVPTALGERVAGAEVHAEVLEQILAQKFLSRPEWATGLERLGVLLFGLVATLLMLLRRLWIGPIAIAVLIAAAFAGSWYAFSDLGLLVGPIFPVAAAGGTYIVITGMSLFLKERERRAIRQQFAHFIPLELIREISENPDEQLTPSGAERELSVMFIDIRNFSTITESMDPKTVVGFVNDFLTPLSDMILDRGGTIDKFIGDAIMAFWNAPTLNEAHAKGSVEALLAMPAALDAINKGFAERGLPTITAGAGVNTGPCSVGFMGSRRRLGYTTIGDTVNLASRLEGLTKPYGVMNCIGEATAKAVAEEFAILEIDAVAVKGRTRPESVSTVLGRKDMLSDQRFIDLKEWLETARQAYADQDWDRAEAAFKRLPTDQIGGLNPAILSGTFLQRIEAFRVSPPAPDWNGVHTATEK